MKVPCTYQTPAGLAAPPFLPALGLQLARGDERAPAVALAAVHLPLGVPGTQHGLPDVGSAGLSVHHLPTLAVTHHRHFGLLEAGGHRAVLADSPPPRHNGGPGVVTGEAGGLAGQAGGVEDTRLAVELVGHLDQGDIILVGPVIVVRVHHHLLHGKPLLLVLEGLGLVVVPDEVLAAGHHRGLPELDGDGEERNVNLWCAVGRSHDDDGVAVEEGGGAAVELVLSVEEGTVPGELVWAGLVPSYYPPPTLLPTASHVPQLRPRHRHAGGGGGGGGAAGGAGGLRLGEEGEEEREAGLAGEKV